MEGRPAVDRAGRARGGPAVDFEVVDIYALGVAGAFPTCEGKVGRFVATDDRKEQPDVRYRRCLPAHGLAGVRQSTCCDRWATGSGTAAPTAWACGARRTAAAAWSHRRLSIIDLSNAALQPMANADGSVAVVFNGEIYNHAELRKELEALGKYRWTHRPLRHRGAAARLRGVGPRVREALLRHVRLRALRRARPRPAGAAPRARPRRHQAALLREDAPAASGCSPPRSARSSRIRTSRPRWTGPPSGTTSPSS